MGICCVQRLTATDKGSTLTLCLIERIVADKNYVSS